MLKKAVIYVRVSSKEQNEQGFSPEAQRVCLYDFARRNAFNVVKEFEDIETAKRAGRKQFGTMLEYVKDNDIKYIFVEKTDRLHRNFKDYVAIEELTEEHGVTVYFVKENNAIGSESKSSEKLMYGMRTLLAKNFIDNLKEEVQKGFQIKLSHGEYPRQAPIGYLNGKDPHNPKHNIIVVDSDNIELVRKMFEYYASDMYSMRSLIEKLNDDGLTRSLPPIIKSGKLYSSLVSRTLSNPFYIGKFLWKGKIIQGSHEPIISVELWEKVQEISGGKNRNWRKEHNVIPFAYKGVFRCGICGRTITAEKAKGKYNYYHCTQYKTKCGQPWVKEETLDERFNQLIKLMGISEAGVEFVSAGLKQSLSEKREWTDKAFDDLVAEQSQLRNRMDNMYEDRLDRKISEPDYDRRFKDYTEQLEKVESQIAKHNRADVNYYEFGHKILELAENAENLLKQAEPEEKRELVLYLLSNSTIKDGEPNFSLKQPFSTIAKHAPSGTCSTWQGCWGSNPE
jgi:site-specific DNA recombinase